MANHESKTIMLTLFADRTQLCKSLQAFTKLQFLEKIWKLKLHSQIPILQVETITKYQNHIHLKYIVSKIR